MWQGLSASSSRPSRRIEERHKFFRHIRADLALSVATFRGRSKPSGPREIPVVSRENSEPDFLLI